MKPLKMHITPLVIAVAAAVSTQAIAADSPRMEAVWGYELGGNSLPGKATKNSDFASISLGLEWETNMSCGAFDPKLSVSAQLNGLTDGFKSMMGDIIQNATAAVTSLPALLIQRANPGLYDLLQQGVLQGKLDFDAAQTSCESIQSFIMGESDLPWESASAGARQQAMANQSEVAAGDAVKAKQLYDAGEKAMLNNGLDWTCGEKRGGQGQERVNTIYDVVVAGYNILHKRSDICDNGSPTTTERDNSLLYPYWTSADSAGDWVTNVVGETKLSVCDTCRKIETSPGASLETKMSDLSEEIYDDLEDIVLGRTELTWQNLNRVSAPPAVVLREPHIVELRRLDAGSQVLVIEDIAKEVAYARVHEQTRLAIRMLRTGEKEPNVQSFTGAADVIDKAVKQLEENNDWIVASAEQTKRLSSQTSIKLLTRAEAELRAASPTYNRPNRTSELGFN